MALIRCPDCGRDISDAAPACPHCGRPKPRPTLREEAEARRANGEWPLDRFRRSWKWIAGAVVVFAVCERATDPAQHEPAQALASASDVPAHLRGNKIIVASDLGAEYFEINRDGTAQMPELFVRRVGKNGATSFTRRLFDCANRTYKYIASGNTEDQLATSTPDPVMTSISDGTIADNMWHIACKK